MRILLVFATKAESQGIRNFLDNHATSEIENEAYSYKNLHIDLLITGVGMISTCYELTKKILQTKYDFIVNGGIAGAFDLALPLGSIVLVSKDRFGDLGIEDAQGLFHDIFDAGLAESDSYPFHEGWIHADLALLKENNFKMGKAITVNKVTGSNLSISKIIKKYQPDIESMEGAACFYVSKSNQIPCLQLRSVSNHVEPRDRSKWNIPLALENLHLGLLHLLEAIHISKA